MPGAAPLLWAGPPASPPGIILFLTLVLLVVVVRVVPKLAWKPTVVAAAVLAALWLPGAVTL